MAKYNFPTLNETSVDQIVVDTATSVPVFIPMFLVFVYFVILISGFRKQRINTGEADAPLWFTLAGVGTTIVALLLSLVPNMISLGTLVIVIIITIISGIWLFASKDRV